MSAEAHGTFFLVMAVVGSGIMAGKLAGGNEAIALLCNTLPTVAVLFVIITIFISVSGAPPSRRLGHYKPSVTLDTYGHLIEGADEAAARAMEGVLK